MIVYWTTVSGRRIEVRALAIVERSSWRTGRAQRRVRVARADNGNVLPKLRSASALHRNPHPGYHGSEACAHGEAYAPTIGWCVTEAAAEAMAAEVAQMPDGTCHHRVALEVWS